MRLPVPRPKLSVSDLAYFLLLLVIKPLHEHAKSKLLVLLIVFWKLVINHIQELLLWRLVFVILLAVLAFFDNVIM